MASLEIATLDRAALERFQTDLIEAGFEPDPANNRIWVGPISPALTGLTEAATMSIRFVDGWPFQHPRLHVDGLDVRHVSAGGEVCLWRPGAVSGEWLTLAGYMKRIEEWARRAHAGFHPEDFALDAHLSFGRIRTGTLATVELEKLQLDGGRGKHDVLSGTWKGNAPVLEIVPGRGGAIEGRWYYVGAVAAPPRDLTGVRALLASNQRNNFDRRFRNVKNDGHPRLFLIAWDRELGREALLLLAERRGEDVVAEAIEVAPTDTPVLRLRAGPDVEVLKSKSVLLFGAGALGSQLGLLLAQSGLGRLVVLDGERLRPGDVVRHAANSWFIGDTKSSAVHLLAYTKAPWTRVTKVERSPWDPELIRGVVESFDLVIEATGLTSFANMLSIICEQECGSLLSAALYRGGAIARVRRQARAEDTAIYERQDDPRYPIVPPGDEPLVFEPGCSSPVNNASPVAVAMAAALAAAIAIDTLTDRNLYGDETIEVTRPLPEPPFDRVGRVELGP